MIIRGSTQSILEETMRAFDDAIGVACGLVQESSILPGGGAIQIALARRLRSFSTTVPGREQ